MRNKRRNKKKDRKKRQENEPGERKRQDSAGQPSSTGAKVKARHMRKHSTANTGKTPDESELEAHSFASL